MGPKQEITATKKTRAPRKAGIDMDAYIITTMQDGVLYTKGYFVSKHNCNSLSLERAFKRLLDGEKVHLLFTEENPDRKTARREYYLKN